MTTKPLAEKPLAFAHEYRGDGVAACVAAGYGGSRASMASIASRLLKDPRVKAVIAERNAAARPPKPPPVEPPPAPVAPVRPARVNVAAAVADAEASGCDPIAVLEGIALGADVHPSSRVAAAKALERHQRETHASSADPFAELRSAMADIIRAKRAREREEETR